MVDEQRVHRAKVRSIYLPEPNIFELRADGSAGGLSFAAGACF